MELDRWNEVERIYHAALEHAASEHAALVCGPDVCRDLLDRECAGDSSLRAEVESLLNYGLDPPEFFEKPAMDLVVAQLVAELSASNGSASDRMIGAQIGPYRILEKLGAGGMGEVFRACRADDQYEKQVAIKLVRQELNTEEMNSRFLRERQILAGFEHENIARLLDGGTVADGQPYFIMELVEGKPIDDYCDQARLGIAARIDLFRSACSAVQYAHGHLVVHRDIKPNNILVTADGVPKLLDFGIATILHAETNSPAADPTETVQRVFTPQYASPEQLRGDAITTATDVYSLGVILFKLLSGRLPYRVDANSSYELARAICEIEPEKPSHITGRAATDRASPSSASENKSPQPTPEQAAACRNTTPEKLRRTLSGDLDQIVLKALRKEPERRYATVQDLSEDLRAYSLALPVSAHRDTVPYRAGKFARRHRFSIAAAMAFLLLALAGVGAVVREAHIARLEQARAARRFNDVRSLANSLLFDVYDSIRNLPGSTPARRIVADRALHYLDTLSQESAGSPDLERELATAYERVGDVQGNPYFANLGDTAGAIQSYRKALRILLDLAGDHPSAYADQAALVAAYMKLGLALDVNDNPSEAMDAYRKAYPIAKAWASDRKDDPQAQETLAGVCFSIASTLADQGDMAGSLEYYRQSAAIREAISGGSKAFRDQVQTRLAGTYGYMAGDLARQGDAASAIALQRKAHVILTEQVGADPENAQLRQFLLQSDYWTGRYSEQMGDFKQAISNYLEALAGYRKLSAADPGDVLAHRYLGLCEMGLGNSLSALGNPDRGFQHARQAVAIFSELDAAGHGSPAVTLLDLAHSQSALGDDYKRLASLPAASKAGLIANWSAARYWFQQSLHRWLVLKQRGLLASFNLSEPDRIAREVANCSAKLQEVARK
jgi:eukaryotic-like serine/threonine-protein kinase